MEKSWLFLLVYLCFPFTTSPSSRVLPLPPLNMRLSSTISNTLGNKLFLESQFIPTLIAGLKLWVFFPLPPPPFFSSFFFFNARNRLNWHFRMLNCTFSWALWFVEIYQKWQDSTSRRCLVVPRSSRNSNHRNKSSEKKNCAALQNKRSEMNRKMLCWSALPISEQESVTAAFSEPKAGKLPFVSAPWAV